MASQSSADPLIVHILQQLIEACEMIIIWNEHISDANQYPESPSGMEKMAATCMLIEAIGEGIKKIERINPEFLVQQSPTTQWIQIIGLRNHIAHGYFNLDADIIFDIAKNEIPALKETLNNIFQKIK